MLQISTKREYSWFMYFIRYEWGVENKGGKDGKSYGTYGVVGKSMLNLARRPLRKRPLGRHTCTWENNIKMCIKQIEFEVTNWINIVGKSD